MPRNPRKYLHDVAAACEAIRSFTAGKSYEDYEHDALVRSAVERQSEIIGEALTQLTKLAPKLAAQVPE